MLSLSVRQTRAVSTLGIYVRGSMRAARGDIFTSINPATGETLASLKAANSKDVEEAVTSAVEGQKEWYAMTGAQRGRVLHRAQRLLRENAYELAVLESADTGKPLSEAVNVDVVTAADTIELYANLSSTACVQGQYLPVMGSGSFGYTIREPLGVCAGIGAWNYPLQIAAWKSAPALACGNSMIFKPASLTPLSAFKLAEIYSEAGLPSGVFNVLTGRDAGERLVEHPRVNKISVTGEVGTGKSILEVSARTLKKVTMELGGKSPVIVFDDADIDNAVASVLAANFFSQGEVCSNGTRVFVHKSIHDTFLRRVVDRTKRIRVGDPMDPDTHMGAIISESHMNRIMEYVRIGQEEGAKLECGGERLTKGSLARGNFMSPAVFSHVKDDMQIAKEEIFGPVMTVFSFNNEEEVIQRANDTEMGLAAGVFTKDLQRAHRVVQRLQAGTCWINNYNVTPSELPFGGHKQSGIGVENSVYAIDHYTQMKTVFVEMKPDITGDIPF
ncbi:Betaine aldehyde dehydrogenase, putative [Perkinsus marinus ATCC 50983]|uniref:Betaine aldehyde dehydrogenase, putative n=1 Tax=Perkinsus marinus (strain ATCC 50983 / TXsc) TaxID=423536 RepID=C5KGY6_PERM5|nr:Betaine aldehyde dehydrogenase, putative [Perkinsus marinus ATCC 50983]EER15848.1 Betaine aldehyde dehydrogenase, putative [Perkinsus marinus ATCC 50983]|eukprot:XP_002784052.1 Betaine aldehyde dehydrogenase, putative [Perkinsus marinus ATCC 50983]